MKTEVYFLRYAFPCTDIRLQQGRITQKEYDYLMNAAVNQETVKRDDLERIFFRAFEEIEQMAKKKKTDKWDYEIIKDYFYHEHNKIIDMGKGIYKIWPESLRELSKVFRAKVIDKKQEKFLVVEYNNGKEIKKRNVLNFFVPEANINDAVMIHYGYAVEKVN
jgi:hydrogenase maturation factor